MLGAVPRIPPRLADAARGRRYTPGHPGSRPGCSRSEELREPIPWGVGSRALFLSCRTPRLYRPAVGLRICCSGDASYSAPICTHKLGLTVPCEQAGERRELSWPGNDCPILGDPRSWADVCSFSGGTPGRLAHGWPSEDKWDGYRSRRDRSPRSNHRRFRRELEADAARYVSQVRTPARRRFLGYLARTCGRHVVLRQAPWRSCG